MRQARLVSIAFALLVAAGSVSAPAQQQVPLPMQPAPPGPYKSIAVTLPPRQSDASLDAFRKELGDIAKKKDSAALAGKVVTKGFFWQREDSDDADAKKSGIDNPAAASFNEAEMEKLAQSTRTDPADWAYPIATGVEVRAKPEAGAAVVEKLGMVMVRILPEEDQANGDWLKLVTPSGKIGYVSGNVLAPFGSDQLCYQKDGGGWKIAGYIGAGTGQE